MAKNIHTQMLAFQKLNLKIPRNGKGNSGGREYNYATLDDLLNIVVPALNNLDLYLTQGFEENKLVTRIYDVDGNLALTSSLELGQPTNAQDLGSRITYFRRYSLISLLGLSTEEDTDAGTGKAPIVNKNPVTMGPSMPPPVTPNGIQSKPLDTLVKEMKSVGALAGATPVEKTHVNPSIPSTQVASESVPPVQNTLVSSLNPKPVYSPAMDKAIKAIESCQNIPALNIIAGHIDTSEKITDEEKTELLDILNKKLSTMPA